MISVYDGEYKGINCICFEYDHLKAKIIPEQGTKLCSLVSKKNGHEYIYQGKTEKYRFSQYGGNFVEGECAGVDEMFPTIDECYYMGGPWSGSYLPDHGEVWARKWNEMREKESVLFQISGIQMPYELKKKVIIHKNHIRFEYTAENRTEFPLNYIWASHMMLAAEEGCRFEFPDKMKKCYTTMSDSKTIGRYGDTFQYPVVTNAAGEIYDVSTYRGMNADDYQKFYFADKFPKSEGWAAICYPDEKKIKITFPEQEVPYLGAIQAEGGSLDLRCMFLEPCTAAFDSPNIAKLHQMESILAPYEIKKWYLDIEIR